MPKPTSKYQAKSAPKSQTKATNRRVKSQTNPKAQSQARPKATARPTRQPTPRTRSTSKTTKATTEVHRRDIMEGETGDSSEDEEYFTPEIETNAPDGIYGVRDVKSFVNKEGGTRIKIDWTPTVHTFQEAARMAGGVKNL